MKPADNKPLDGGVEELAGVHTPYEPPSLEVIGAVTEFTFGSKNGNSDAGGMAPKGGTQKGLLY